MSEVLFTLALFLAVIAVIYDIYGEVVLIGAFLLFLWWSIDLLGAHPVFAVFVIIVTGAIRFLVAAALESEDDGPSPVEILLDALLTDEDDPPGGERPPQIWADQADGGREYDEDVDKRH